MMEEPDKTNELTDKKIELETPPSSRRQPVQDLPLMFFAAALGLLVLLLSVGGLAYLAMSRGH